MPELGSYGSVRGARGNSRPYREQIVAHRKSSMSAVPRKRSKSEPWASVAKGHGGGRHEPLQRPVMMVARFYRSITRTALGFERGFS